jgi:hypothetical protein
MLRKPIFEENYNPNENMIFLNEQISKSSLIKNEEESLKKDDLNKLVESTPQKFKEEPKNSEAQTKQTNTNSEEYFKFHIQYRDLINKNNILFLPHNLYYPFSFLKLANAEENKENKEILHQKRGRKTEKEVLISHNKFANDNLRKKSKHIILSELLNFLNMKLREIYNGNLGSGILLKQLLTMNHKQKSNINISDNKIFLQKTLQDIFSDEISKRYTNFPSTHNKDLINRLLNEEDDQKRNYFNKLFNLTFIQVLHHFQNKEKIEELLGLKTYIEALKKYENEKDYYENLVFHITNFQEIIDSKKSRLSKKRKDNILIEISKNNS